MFELQTIFPQLRQRISDGLGKSKLNERDATLHCLPRIAGRRGLHRGIAQL